MESSDFSRLLRRAQDGEPDAVQGLYDEHIAGVLRTIRAKLTGNLRRRYDTLDLGHSVYLEVLAELPRFEDRGPRAFRSWLSIKATSKVNAKFRKILKHGQLLLREVPLVHEAEDPRSRKTSLPLREAIGNEDRERIRAAFSRLSEKHRQVLRLRCIEERPHAEIARWMKLTSAEAARKLHVQAILALRKRMRSD
jgi:RNA polymerase sigma factor (sigma-70 family)